MPENKEAESTPKTVNVYIVRHAESRYNDAKKNKNIAGFVGETDHGLSDQGVRQCLKLNSAIRAAAKDDDCSDAKLILSRGNTLSSPLSRAILTAHLALPMNNDESEGVEVSTGEGGEADITAEEEKKEQQKQHRVVALAEAREHCLMPVFAKDSIGTSRKQIDLKVAAELAAAMKIDEKEDAIIDSSLPLVVDTSRIESDEWWIVGEKSSAVSERLGQLLCKLYDEAEDRSGEDDDAVVLVAHSRVIRTLIRNFGDVDGDKEGKSIISDMKEKFVDNCAVIRLTLQANGSKQSEEEEKGEKVEKVPPKIVDAAFMFGTGFVEEKPKKKRFFGKH